VSIERCEQMSLDELLAGIGGRVGAHAAPSASASGPPAPPRPSRDRHLLRALLSIVRRDMATDLSYRFKLSLQAVLLALWALMFGFLAEIIDGSEPELRGEPLGFLLIGLAALELSQVAMTHMANALREEQLQGTLEPLLATGRNPLLVVLGSVVWRLTVVLAMATLVLGVGMTVLGALGPNANIAGALAAFALGLAAWVARGLMSAGFVHACKRGDPVALAFNVASLVTAGAYFPRALLPAIVQDLTAALPHTTMLAATRAALLSGAGFESADFREPFMRLAGSVVVLVPLALLVWRAAHRRARARGTLASA
jgi:ABC-2 type transport system permease protein